MSHHHRLKHSMILSRDGGMPVYLVSIVSQRVSSHVPFDQFTHQKLTVGAIVVGDDVGLFVGVCAFHFLFFLY